MFTTLCTDLSTLMTCLSSAVVMLQYQGINAPKVVDALAGPLSRDLSCQMDKQSGPAGPCCTDWGQVIPLPDARAHVHFA